MPSLREPELRRTRARRSPAPFAIAWGVAAAAFLQLAAWLLPVPVLRQPPLGRAGTNPTVALALLLAALALTLLARPAGAARRALAAACAGLVALIGALRLLENSGLADAGIDFWLTTPALAAAHDAFVDLPAAWGFLALGAALLLLATERRPATAAARGLLLATALLTLAATIGHLFAAPEFHGAISFVAALGLLAIATGALALDLRSGPWSLLASTGPGGALVRRVLPTLTVLFVSIEFLRFTGRQREWFSAGAGASLQVLTTVVAGIGVVVLIARALDRTEDERARAEERYRRLFELHPLPIWVFDRETLDILAFNEAVLETYGYDRAELRSMSYDQIRPAEDVEAFRREASDERRQRDRRVRRHLRKGGQVMEVEVDSLPIEFAGRPARISAVRDVTVERRHAAALAASEARYRAVAETATDAIVSADAAGEIRYVNPAAERLFGLGAERMLGRPVAELMPERYREAHRRGLDRFLATGQGRVVGRTVELAALRPAGDEFPIELSLASWRDGDRIAFTAIFRDVTERREDEAALRRYAAELEAANAELDAFAYSVSHDLSAPLRGLDGFSQALLDDYAERLDPPAVEHLRRIRGGAQRMATLIDDLLRLSRVTRTEMRREQVDLGAMAHEIVAELRRREPGRDVDLLVGGDLVVHGDGRLLRIARANLLENAWKYTRRRPFARIELGRQGGPGSTTFFVRDDGVGFDPADAHRLFAPFSRLHSEDEFEGSGIGLATVLRVVRRHGGRAWAEAEIGKGATIYFTLEGNSP